MVWQASAYGLLNGGSRPLREMPALRRREILPFGQDDAALAKGSRFRTGVDIAARLIAVILGTTKNPCAKHVKIVRAAPSMSPKMATGQVK
jgi:hypothetical protein